MALHRYGPDAWLVPRSQARVHRPHDHAFDRLVSRRSLIPGSAAAVAGLAALPLRGTRAAPPGGADPSPIPSVLDPSLPIHIRLPGVLHPADDEPSTITDFNGALAYAIIDGTGVGSDGESEAEYTFELDIRGMEGQYVDTEGKHRRGAFALL